MAYSIETIKTDDQKLIVRLLNIREHIMFSAQSCIIL